MYGLNSYLFYPLCLTKLYVDRSNCVRRVYLHKVVHGLERSISMTWSVITNY